MMSAPAFKLKAVKTNLDFLSASIVYLILSKPCQIILINRVIYTCVKGSILMAFLTRSYF